MCVTAWPINGGQAGALEPAPDGVTGGLLDGGSRGTWLRTPAGWRVVAGVDTARSGTTDATTFALAAVCLPAPSTPPSSAAPTPTPTPLPSRSRSAAATGPTLPVTGTRTAVVAGVGALLVLLGGAAVAVAARRRRDRIRFVA